LLEQVVGILADAGAGTGVLKHAKRGFDLDRDPGKDSHRLRSVASETFAPRVVLPAG
jgi:molybdopterin-guanine dinucleotide biosynthesis protein